MNTANNIGKISLILPAYNEAGNISEVIDKSNALFKKNNWDAEIIVINDGSNDSTKEEAGAKCKEYNNVVLINHRRNLGLSQALMSGFRYSQGDTIIFLCSDMQSNPEEDIPKLVEGIEEGYDVVCGWRQGRKEVKIIVSKIYHVLSNILFNIKLHDLNWIKAFRREVIDEISLRPGWHRYLIIMAAHRGYKIKEIKTNYYPRKYGKSKFGKNRILKGFLDLLVVKFELSFLEKPMLLFGSAGFGLILLAIVITLGLFIYKFLTGIGYRPLLTLISLLILLGIQLIALGFLSELIVSVYMKIKQIEEKMKKIIKNEQL